MSLQRLGKPRDGEKSKFAFVERLVKKKGTKLFYDRPFCIICTMQYAFMGLTRIYQNQISAYAEVNYDVFRWRRQDQKFLRQNPYLHRLMYERVTTPYDEPSSVSGCEFRCLVPQHCKMCSKAVCDQSMVWSVDTIQPNLAYTRSHPYRRRILRATVINENLCYILREAPSAYYWIREFIWHYSNEWCQHLHVQLIILFSVIVCCAICDAVMYSGRSHTHTPSDRPSDGQWRTSIYWRSIYNLLFFTIVILWLATRMSAVRTSKTRKPSMFSLKCAMSVKSI